MKITHLKLNHLTNPVGFDLLAPTVSYIVEDASGKFQKSARILVAADGEPAAAEISFRAESKIHITDLMY